MPLVVKLTISFTNVLNYKSELKIDLHFGAHQLTQVTDRREEGPVHTKDVCWVFDTQILKLPPEFRNVFSI